MPTPALSVAARITEIAAGEGMAPVTVARDTGRTN